MPEAVSVVVAGTSPMVIAVGILLTVTMRVSSVLMPPAVALSLTVAVPTVAAVHVVAPADGVPKVMLPTGSEVHPITVVPVMSRSCLSLTTAVRVPVAP